MTSSLNERVAGDDPADFRKALRLRALAAREALPAATRAHLTAALTSHLQPLVERLAPRSLGFCWPYRAEPDLRGFVAGWLAADPARTAALPVVLDRGKAMVFRRWHPEVVLSEDRYGIPVPPEGEEVVPDVVLVPLNAFDPAGFRIGYGGGYFDRTLAVMDSVAVGVGFELGRVDSVRPQTHDKPMRWTVTEAGAWSHPPAGA